MALKTELTELLSLIQDPTERQQQEKLFEKYPVLQDGFLRQSDYSKNMTELKTQKDTFEADKTKWSTWYNDSKPEYDRALAKQKELETQKTQWEKDRADLQAKVAAAASEGNVDPAELTKLVDAELAKRGYVSQADMTKIISDKEAELTKKFTTESLPAAMTYTLAMARFDGQYKADFNETFDEKAFSKYVTERNIFDPYEGYKQFTADKQKEKDIKAAEERGAAAARAAFTQQAGVPGSGVTPPAEKGPTQLFIMGEQPAKGLENARPGTGALAAAAAAELRAEGKV